jgi:hypothetical protein
MVTGAHGSIKTILEPGLTDPWIGQRRVKTCQGVDIDIGSSYYLRSVHGGCSHRGRVFGTRATNWKETMAVPIKPEEPRKIDSLRPWRRSFSGTELFRQLARHGGSAGTAAFDPAAILPYHKHGFSEAIALLSGAAQVAVEGRSCQLEPLY